MTFLKGNYDILMEDIYAYKLIKNELDKFQTGREAELSFEYSDLAVDAGIKKIFEKNKTANDPKTLKKNFKNLAMAYARVFSALRNGLSIIGTNLPRRKDQHEELAKHEPQHVILFHKRPVWREFLTYIASFGGTVDTGTIQMKYLDRFRHLMNLTMEAGIGDYIDGGRKIQMKSDYVKEFLDRAIELPQTPLEARVRNEYKYDMMSIIDVLENIDKKEIVSEKIDELRKNLLRIEIVYYMHENQYLPLIQNGIQTIYDLIEAPLKKIRDLLETSVNEVCKLKLYFVPFVKYDVRELPIEIFDYDIYKKLSADPSNATIGELKKSDINTWGDLLQLRHVMRLPIKSTNTSRKNVLRLISFCNYILKRTVDYGRSFYTGLPDNWNFVEHLPSNIERSIRRKYRMPAAEWAQSEQSEIDDDIPFEEENGEVVEEAGD